MFASRLPVVDDQLAIDSQNALRFMSTSRVFGFRRSVSTRPRRKSEPGSTLTAAPGGSTGRRLVLSPSRLHQNFAEIAALARLDRAARRPCRMSHFDFESVVLRAQTVETEVAERIGLRLRDLDAVADEGDVGPLHAIDDAIGLDRDASADELGFPALEPTIPDPRLCAEFGSKRPQVLASRTLGHRLVVELHRFEDVGRTDLTEARLLPAGVEKMGVEDPGLRDLLLLVPDDSPIGAGVDDVLAALGLHWVDDDDAVVTFADGVAGEAHAWRVVAVIAHHRQIGGLHHRRAALDAAQDADCAVADGGGWRGISRGNRCRHVRPAPRSRNCSSSRSG